MDQQPHSDGVEFADDRPDQPQRVHTGFAVVRGRLRPVEFVESADRCFIDGDICIGTSNDVFAQTCQARLQSRLGVALGVVIPGEDFRWPDGVIPYEVDPDLPNPVRVAEARRIIEETTTLLLVERTSENAEQYPDYVRIIDAGGCWSYVGRRGSKQDLSIGVRCSVGNLVHEFFHTAGFWHTQSREDRDAFVRIRFENIISGRENNFARHVDDGDDYGPYDYGSIMHYPRMAFSKNGLPTIEPLDSTVTIGQRVAPSEADIRTLEDLYDEEPKTEREIIVQRRRLAADWVGTDKPLVVEVELPARLFVTWNVVPMGNENDFDVTHRVHLMPGRAGHVRHQLVVINAGGQRVRVQPRYLVHRVVRK